MFCHLYPIYSIINYFEVFPIWYDIDFTTMTLKTYFLYPMKGLACYVTFVFTYIFQNIHRGCCCTLFFEVFLIWVDLDSIVNVTLKRYFPLTFACSASFFLTHVCQIIHKETCHDILNITTHRCTSPPSSPPFLLKFVGAQHYHVQIIFD